MLTDTELCSICAAPSRDASLLCVVESPADVVAVDADPLRNIEEMRRIRFVMKGGVVCKGGAPRPTSGSRQ
jgi:recombinational DNA repair protein RecR